MSFPDYPYFSNPSFGYSSSLNPFQGGPSSQLKSSSSSGGSKLDPFSIAMAGVGGLGSAVGGIFGSQGAAQAAYQNAMMAGAGLQYKQAEALGSLGQARWVPMFGAGTGGDISFAREKEGEKFKQFFTRPQDLLYSTQAAERARAFSEDPRTRQQSARDRKNELEMESLKAGFQTSRMFGPIGQDVALAGKYGLFA
jgi:hypothetical protein